MRCRIVCSSNPAEEHDAHEDRNVHAAFSLNELETSSLDPFQVIVVIRGGSQKDDSFQQCLSSANMDSKPAGECFLRIAN